MILNNDQIKIFLVQHPAWSLAGDKLSKETSFADFDAAIKYVDAVAVIAGQQQHHPDIDIRYNKVTLNTFSHDAGGITERDIKLVEALDNFR